MHPMAVYCELLGMQPMMLETLDWPRIRYHKTDHERHLVWRDRGGWRVEISGRLNEYTTTTWEEIPDGMLDTLTIELINELRDHP